ncbi:hypothetical protein ACFL9U_00805 [Thermodesulfobacteriota bacterium]
MNDDDYEKIKREIVFEKVDKAIKKDRKNWVKEVENLGFEWFDDGDCDEEEREEKLARPENPNQELLVAYFEGDIELSDQALDAFLSEKDLEEPNYPLFRKYFRQGNENLKRLITSGLERNPADIGFLSDLAFFHEFKNILRELIGYYLIGCEQEKDLRNFKELALNFYYDTEPDGFDALYELGEKYGPDSDKGKIVRRIIQKQETKPESIVFRNT